MLKYIIIMAQPLLLKSNLLLPNDQPKHQVLSVSELLRKFEIKSPSHKLIAPSKSSKQLLGSPKADKHLFKKSIETEFKTKTQISRSESRRGEVGKSRRDGQMKCDVHEINLNKLTSPKNCNQHVNRSTSKVMNSNSTSSITKQKQQILRKIHKELIKINLASVQNQNPKVPPLKFQQKSRPLIPLSDRDLNIALSNPNLGSVSARSHVNIKLPTRTEYDVYTNKNSKQVQSINCFRKESNASTLSLRSKHTLSMQHLEDYEELFPKASSELPADGPEHTTNPLSALRDVKAKIYQQIDSLDKKLLQNTTEDKNRLIKIICRKKKREKGLDEAAGGTKPQANGVNQGIGENN